MDLTVLHLAVPSLSAALQPSSAQLLWIIDIYGFLVAGSLITMGTLGDRIGRRRLLLIGPALLSVARDAFVQGLHLAAAISGVVAIGAAILAMILLRGVPAHAEHERIPELEAVGAATTVG